MAAAGEDASLPWPPGRVQRLRTMITNKTVTEMKGILRDLTAKTPVKLGISGTKQVLINRLIDQLDSWHASGSWVHLRTMMNLTEAMRDTKGFMLEVPNGGANGNDGGNTAGHPSNTWNAQSHNSAMAPAAAYLQRSNSNYGMGNVPSNKINQSRPNGGYVGQAGTASAVRTGHVPARVQFKTSPFWKIESFLGPPIIVTEAAMQSRKEAVLDLKLNPQVSSLIKSQEANYHVRLFCTTKAAAEMSERHPTSRASVEFPVSCELRVNGTAHSVNLKGSKKSPGRVPPPNLNKDKTLITREGLVNKITLVYANTTQKYVMVAAFCSYTSVDDIVAKLRREKHKSREEIIGSMKRAAAEEDIEVGTSTLSLRDPLSLTRIQAPCRSIHCSHSQCFDATFFMMSNEQSPTWNCPHCNSTLQPEDLFIDGYFEDILKRVPEDEDAVEFEQDGTWKTKDGKISSSSAGVSAAPPMSADSDQPTTDTQPQQTSAVKGEVDSSASLPPATDSRNGTNGNHSAEIVLLDDDTPTPPPSRVTHPEEESGTPIAPSMAAGDGSGAASQAPSGNGHRTGGSSATEAIDLTLSDSEDEDARPLSGRAPVPPPPPMRLQQRPGQDFSPAATSIPVPPRSGPRSFFEPRQTSSSSMSGSSPMFAQARMQVNGGNAQAQSSPSSATLPPRPSTGNSNLTDFFPPQGPSAQSSSSSHTASTGVSPRLFTPVLSRPSGPASAGATRNGYNFWPPRRSNTMGETAGPVENTDESHRAASTSSASMNGVPRTAAVGAFNSVSIRPREDDPLADSRSSSTDDSHTDKRARLDHFGTVGGGLQTNGAAAGPVSSDRPLVGAPKSAPPPRPPPPPPPPPRASGADGDADSSTEEEGEISPSPPPTRSVRRRGPIVDGDDSMDSGVGSRPARRIESPEASTAEEGEVGRMPSEQHPSSLSSSGPNGTTSQQSRQTADWDDYDELIEDGDDSLYANLPDGS